MFQVGLELLFMYLSYIIQVQRGSIFEYDLILIYIADNCIIIVDFHGMWDLPLDFIIPQIERPLYHNFILVINV